MEAQLQHTCRRLFCKFRKLWNLLIVLRKKDTNMTKCIRLYVYLHKIIAYSLYVCLYNNFTWHNCRRRAHLREVVSDKKCKKLYASKWQDIVYMAESCANFLIDEMTISVSIEHCCTAALQRLYCIFHFPLAC